MYGYSKHKFQKKKIIIITLQPNNKLGNWVKKISWGVKDAYL